MSLNLDPIILHADSHPPNDPTQKILGTTQPPLNLSDTTIHSTSYRTNVKLLPKRMKSPHWECYWGIVIKSIPNIILSMRTTSLPTITTFASLFSPFAPTVIRSKIAQTINALIYWIGTIHVQLQDLYTLSTDSNPSSYSYLTLVHTIHTLDAQRNHLSVDVNELYQPCLALKSHKFNARDEPQMITALDERFELIFLNDSKLQDRDQNDPAIPTRQNNSR